MKTSQTEIELDAKVSTSQVININRLEVII